ncbi:MULTISPECIES: hypothetical protein [Paraburkholderia]|uniref:hypothetical protein n=1 Tax=Paraburkholderia TaxID=1822464 RepID=UPI00101A0583|nr:MULTISPECIES: hypothetical protein [Paraburkholderia]
MQYQTCDDLRIETRQCLQGPHGFQTDRYDSFYGDSFDTLPEVAGLFQQVKTKILSFGDLLNSSQRDIPTVDVSHSRTVCLPSQAHEIEP